MKKTPMRRAREKAELTITHVAIKTGIPYSTVYALDTGLGRGVSIERKTKIAAALGAPLFSLWPDTAERKETVKTPMRRAREKAGLTLGQVSAGTGIPLSTVYTLDIGLGQEYSIERKAKIAAFLGVSFSSLWPEEGKKIKQAQKLYAEIIKGATRHSDEK